MTLNINTVMLGGNLTRDPETKSIGSSGKTVASFGIAINRKYKASDGEQKEETTFVDIEAWGRTAELAAQYLAKGSSVFIEGKLKLETWDDKDGNKRSKMKVVAESIQFVGPPKTGSSTTEPDRPAKAKPVSVVHKSDAVAICDEPPF